MTFCIFQISTFFILKTSFSIPLRNFGLSITSTFICVPSHQHVISITPAAISALASNTSIHSVGNIHTSTIPIPRKTKMSPDGLFLCRFLFIKNLPRNECSIHHTGKFDSRCMSELNFDRTCIFI